MVAITRAEATQILDPPMTAEQVSALIGLAEIPVIGHRRLGGRGRPPQLYDRDRIITEHATEAARTLKQFTDTDWIAEGLLGRHRIIADPQAGTLHWPNGERAEQLAANFYGIVNVGPQLVPAHRIIWIAGDGPIPPGIQINHINRLRWDNHRSNLELVTFAENIRHGYGQTYLTYPEAVRELAALATEGGTEPEPVSCFIRGGFVRSWRERSRAGWI